MNESHDIAQHFSHEKSSQHNDMISTRRKRKRIITICVNDRPDPLLIDLCDSDHESESSRSGTPSQVHNNDEEQQRLVPQHQNNDPPLSPSPFVPQSDTSVDVDFSPLPGPPPQLPPPPPLQLQVREHEVSVEAPSQSSPVDEDGDETSDDAAIGGFDQMPVHEKDDALVDDTGYTGSFIQPDVSVSNNDLLHAYRRVSADVEHERPPDVVVTKQPSSKRKSRELDSLLHMFPPGRVMGKRLRSRARSMGQTLTDPQQEEEKEGRKEKKRRHSMMNLRKRDKNINYKESRISKSPVCTDDESEDDDSDEEWSCPICHTMDEGPRAILCDFCDQWYHYPCAGITRAPRRVTWSCAACIRSNKNK